MISTWRTPGGWGKSARGLETGLFLFAWRRYVGSGVVAVLAEVLDDEERVQAIWERDQNREARQAELAKFQEVRERAAG